MQTYVASLNLVAEAGLEPTTVKWCLSICLATFYRSITKSVLSQICRTFLRAIWMLFLWIIFLDFYDILSLGLSRNYLLCQVFLYLDLL